MEAWPERADDQEAGPTVDPSHIDLAVVVPDGTGQTRRTWHHNCKINQLAQKARNSKIDRGGVGPLRCCVPDDRDPRKKPAARLRVSSSRRDLVEPPNGDRTVREVAERAERLQAVDHEVVDGVEQVVVAVALGVGGDRDGEPAPRADDGVLSVAAATCGTCRCGRARRRGRSRRCSGGRRSSRWCRRSPPASAARTRPGRVRRRSTGRPRASRSAKRASSLVFR